MELLCIYLVMTISIAFNHYIRSVKSGEKIDRWFIIELMLGMVLWPIILIGVIISAIKKHKKLEGEA